MQTPVTDDAANTNFSGPTGAMAQITSLLPRGGDGATAANPRQALLIVTDGMQDYNPIPGDGNRTIVGNPSTSSYQEGPMNPDTVTPRDCDAAKAKGIIVYVIYTTYDADSTVLLYNNSELAPYLAGTSDPGMVASLQACASTPNFFIQATDAAAITSAFNTLLQTALSSPGRFTQ